MSEEELERAREREADERRKLHETEERADEAIDEAEQSVRKVEEAAPEPPNE